MTEPAWLTIARLRAAAFRNTERCGQGALIGPSALQSQDDREVGKSCSACPSGSGVGDAVACQHTILAGVIHLLVVRGPAAIASFVGAVVVFTLNGVARRRFRSHVRQEVLKRLPSAAHRDAAAAVIGVVRCVRILATSLHRAPRSIFRRLAEPISVVAVNPFDRRPELAYVAAARFSRPTNQGGDSHRGGVTARAITQPFFSLGVVRDRRQAIKCLARQISSRHLLIIELAVLR